TMVSSWLCCWVSSLSRSSSMGSPTLCTLSNTTPLPNSNGPTGTGSPSSSTGLCREYPGVLALATLLLVTLSAPCSASRPLTAIDKVPKRLDNCSSSRQQSRTPLLPRN